MKKHHFRVGWSEKDQGWVATCTTYSSSLKALAHDPASALMALAPLVVAADLEFEKESAKLVSEGITERPLDDAELENMCSRERGTLHAHEMVRVLEAHDHWKKRALRAETKVAALLATERVP